MEGEAAASRLSRHLIEKARAEIAAANPTKPSDWIDDLIDGAAVALGALNGLLPCGLVYSALLAVAAGGGALRAGAAMLVFGAATIPVLVALGLGAARLGVRARGVLTKIAGVLIIAVGVQLMLRGAAGLGLLDHAQLGGLVLW